MSLNSPEHPLFKGIKPVNHIIDIGPGIKPVRFFTPKTHLCIEPCDMYAEILHFNGYDVVTATAKDMILRVEPVDSIFMLDVIEHMEKDEGLWVIEKAKQKTRNQLIVFTPLGFKEQSTDKWGFGQDYWQTHRSGWSVQDFEGFDVKTDKKSIFAIWSPS